MHELQYWYLPSLHVLYKSSSAFKPTWLWSKKSKNRNLSLLLEFNLTVFAPCDYICIICTRYKVHSTFPFSRAFWMIFILLTKLMLLIFNRNKIFSRNSGFYCRNKLFCRARKFQQRTKVHYKLCWKFKERLCYESIISLTLIIMNII